MIAAAWRMTKVVGGHVGLALPLLAIALTRHRWAVAAIVLALGAAATLARTRAPRVFRAIAAIYLILCAFLVAGTAEIVDSISSDAWLRIAATGLSLAGALHVLGRAFAPGTRRAQRLGEARARLTVELGSIALAISALRLGQLGLWPNPGIVSGLAVALVVLHFRPRPLPRTVFVLCAVFAVYEWHGFMTTQTLEAIEHDPASGVRLHVLDHGSPQDLQGARYFARGQCPETRGSLYMGEMKRTYRLDPDGSQVDLVVPDARGVNEATCSVIELCDRRMVVTGSDEGRFLRFSDLVTGARLQDLPLRGQPTFSVLSPDGRHVYTSVINPGAIVRTDVATRTIDREFTRFVDDDPAFSGINNLILSEGRLVASYSSYFTLDDPPGHVFSVDLELEDYRELMTFHGSWGIVSSGPPGAVYFKIYSRPGLYRVAADASGATKVADVPAGYHYLSTLERPSLVVLNHWSTGELVAYCRQDMSLRFHMSFGGMGRGMTVYGNELLTAVPAGYATLTFPEDLCGHDGMDP